MTFAIETLGLTKLYKASPIYAVSDLSFHVGRGELFGLLGPNGAGKTTIIRILMTLLRPSSGRAWIEGCDVLREPVKALRRVGYLPELVGLHGDLTGRQHLRYWGELYGLEKSEVDSRLHQLASRVGMDEIVCRKTKALSLGERRRLAIAGALLPDPELIVLDEPSMGLDPGGMAFIRNLMVDLHKEGRTIFLSSHMLMDMARVCTRVGVLHRGEMLRIDTPQRIVRAMGQVEGELIIEADSIPQDIQRNLAALPEVASVTVEDRTIILEGCFSDACISTIIRGLIESGVSIRSLNRREADLETAFLTLTGEGQ